jgi:hypothetical protein
LLPWRCNASNAIFCHDEGCRKGRVGTCWLSPPSSNAANASTIQASWLVSYKLPTRSPGGRAVSGGGGGTGDGTGTWAATAAVGNCCSPGGQAVGGGGGETGDGTGTGAWAATAAAGNCGSGHGLNCRRFCGTHDGRTEPVAGMWANWRENQQKNQRGWGRAMHETVG